MKTQS